MLPYRFCARCTKPLRTGSETMLVCDSCGAKYFDNPKLTINIIVENENGEILFARRKNDPFQGTWDTPGGFAEIGETAEEAARRELMEETGLELPVEAMHYQGSYTDDYEYQGTTYALLAITFTARLTGKNSVMRPADDASELKFFKKDEIPWEDLLFRSDRIPLLEYLGLPPEEPLPKTKI